MTLMPYISTKLPPMASMNILVAAYHAFGETGSVSRMGNSPRICADKRGSGKCNRTLRDDYGEFV